MTYSFPPVEGDQNQNLSSSALRFNMLAKTRQTWKMDGMNTVEYKILSREYLPLYTNITVDIGTESGLRPPAQPLQAAAKPAVDSSTKLQDKAAAVK